MFSILEQHSNGSWWYHPGDTFGTQEEAAIEGWNVYGSGACLTPRDYKIIEHQKPFPQDMARCSFDCVHFDFAGGYHFSLEDEEDKPLKERKDYPLKLVTSKEFDPFTAGALNARFCGFFVRFCEQTGLDLKEAAARAHSILQDAEIDQN